MWSWLRKSRTRTAIPDRLWRATLDRIPCLRTLTMADQARLRTLSEKFLDEKIFEGAAGLVVTDRMRVEIAAQACLLTLNLDRDYYRGWRTVILYPGDFRVAKEHMDEAGVVHEWTEDLAGESWEGGPVILSWATHRAGDSDINIVLHEFAHKLDMLDGVANGCPPLPREISPQRWARDFEAAYDQLCVALDRGEQTAIDEYAAESPAEFFAVMTEQFFLQPNVVWNEFPAVYSHLRDFYHQDPLARSSARERE